MDRSSHLFNSWHIEHLKGSCKGVLHSGGKTANFGIYEAHCLNDVVPRRNPHQTSGGQNDASYNSSPRECYTPIPSFSIHHTETPNRNDVVPATTVSKP
ncbi:unnamed protein product [Sphenostylis stenocarpa]|uniref:Uncharacterized protein n=1 Tax=Sphenostylis stenocarpa TaxID=92480 RepID=A0AA86SX66_9FABA|nr:unnamed protein product [Sphenostylis stenocarpa]